ncbi:PLP-dependent aminotransferase family protein [Gorillibacterium massiliense]|uniref:aminotransferase-like domain-containing protein n=1 Tax=Gorillibacterium massiliense TaxID=1280390 RepID=UPI0004AC91BE|nr:PLP-dependent aminotransferase family protein [Gorillibacterium massiliense]
MKTIDWTPDRASPIPLHKQIEEYIRAKILHGEWTVGTVIPSQRTLAETFGVNRSTVVEALNELSSLGLLEGKTGGGTRIVNTTWSLMASSPPTDWQSYVSAGISQPNMPTIQEINLAEFVPGIIRLGTGELAPELLPDDDILQLFQSRTERKLALGYEEPKGNLFLRQQIAGRLKSIGIQAAASSILIVSGALQALQLISIGLLGKESTILAENPSYLHSVPVFQSAGMKLQSLPMDDDGLETWLVPTYQKQYKASLIYTIPTFHNPTGLVMPEQRRQQLIRLCNEERLPIIEDDVYRELWLDSPPPLPLKSFDQNGNVLYIGSLSKSVSPGLRIGWLVGPEPVIERLADVKMQTDYGSSALSQWAAGEWLAGGRHDMHLARLRENLRNRRDHALEILERNFRDIARWRKPSGGFYIWLRLEKPVSMRSLFEQAKKAGILLNPGPLYDRSAADYLRISYSYASLQELEKGLTILSGIIREHLTASSQG